MTKEFNLSEKITTSRKISEILEEAKEGSTGQYIMTGSSEFVHTSFVKEFIRLLKKEIDEYECSNMDYSISTDSIRALIDKLAGEKLNEENQEKWAVTIN